MSITPENDGHENKRFCRIGNAYRLLVYAERFN
jgi:hypothetical protein